MLGGYARSWSMGPEAAPEDGEEEAAEDMTGAVFCFFPGGGLLESAAAAEEEEEEEEEERFVTYSSCTVFVGLVPKAMYRVESPKRSVFPALKTSTPCTSWPFPDSAMFTLLR